jgi:hypothetical protein
MVSRLSLDAVVYRVALVRQALPHWRAASRPVGPQILLHHSAKNSTLRRFLNLCGPTAKKLEETECRNREEHLLKQD